MSGTSSHGKQGSLYEIQDVWSPNLDHPDMKMASRHNNPIPPIKPMDACMQGLVASLPLKEHGYSKTLQECRFKPEVRQVPFGLPETKILEKIKIKESQYYFCMLFKYKYSPPLPRTAAVGLNIASCSLTEK